MIWKMVAPADYFGVYMKTVVTESLSEEVSK